MSCLTTRSELKILLFGGPCANRGSASLTSDSASVQHIATMRHVSAGHKWVSSRSTRSYLGGRRLPEIITECRAKEEDPQKTYMTILRYFLKLPYPGRGGRVWRSMA